MRARIILEAAVVAILTASIAFAQPGQQQQTRSIVSLPFRPPTISEIPSGTVPTACQAFKNQGVGAAGALLGCFLNDASNQVIAMSISWGFNNQFSSWKQWPAWAKQDLVNAFIH